MGVEVSHTSSPSVTRRFAPGVEGSDADEFDREDVFSEVEEAKESDDADDSLHRLASAKGSPFFCCRNACWISRRTSGER